MTLRALAKMRAIDVLPTPRVPQKRYACAVRSGRDRVPQRPRDRLLPDELVEVLRAVAPGEDGVAQVVLSDRVAVDREQTPTRPTGSDDRLVGPEKTARTPPARTTPLMAAAVKP